MEANRVLHENTHVNAYTNNTFSLEETEKSIRRTCDNSFNYLKELQRSYVSIRRFNLTENDTYTDHNNKVCISLDKDFIDFPLRKKYKNSPYYSKYIPFNEVLKHPEIFTFTPIVKIDGQVLFSFEIKSALDGHTDIRFPHIIMTKTFMATSHTIEVAFVKDGLMRSFMTNKYSMEYYNWTIPANITELTLDKDVPTFIFIKNKNEIFATDMIPVSVSENGSLIINGEEPYIKEYFETHTSDVDIIVFTIPYLHKNAGQKIIQPRIDNGVLSATAVIEPSPHTTYKMAIPPENILIIKKNKETGETTYENNRKVILHYPNIYEIISDDVDADIYEYEVYYLYREIQNDFEYKNHLKHIYQFLAQKCDLPLEETIKLLLYTKIDDDAVQDCFFSIFDYIENDYVYNHGDFFATNFPYDFDYKIGKMKEFTKENPDTLEDYGKNVSTPFSSFYMYTENIDLDERIRDNTHFEAVTERDLIEFDEPHYLFRFQNESGSELQLRFFIDGILYPNPIQFNVNSMDYIYIPTRLISPKSYIEIEKFHEYSYSKKIVFESTATGIDLDFTKNPLIAPTLHDLYVSNASGEKIDRSKFRMYALINLGEYDVSDYINKMADMVDILLDDPYIIDETTGQLYIYLDDLFDEESASILLTDPEIIDENDERLPLKYMVLTKLRIFCSSEDMINTPYFFNIDKTAHMTNCEITSHETPRFLLYNIKHSVEYKSSYIRSFINGRFIPIEYQISENGNETTIVPKCYVYPGDIVTFDLTPYSYDLVYEMDVIPEDFTIDMTGFIDKPFNSYYYDIYLNGRKLSDNNFEAITPTLIKLFNVHSRNKLYVYKRDRDYEYYGLSTDVVTPVSEFLSSPTIPDEYKNELMDIIIYDNHGETLIGDDTEMNWYNEYELDEVSSQEYDFYFNVILPRKITRPNSFLLSHFEIETRYPHVYDIYSNKVDRLVVRPNAGPESSHLLLVGKKCDGIITL